MSNYKIRGIDVNTWDLIPIKTSESPLSIIGAWDMPERIGKAFHDWGNDSDGIEPYVLASEIRFGGRDIKLNCVMRGVDRIGVMNRCNSIYNAIGSDLFLLESDKYGTYDVYVNGAIEVDYKVDGIALVTFNFRQPVVPIVAIIPAPTNAGIGIDGISFEQLGIIPISTKGQYNRPAPKNGTFTSYKAEGYAISATSVREIDFRFAMVCDGYIEFSAKVSALQALFAKEGLRYITKENDALRTFFVKDGFKVTVLDSIERFIAYIDIKITEVGAHLDWSFLMDYQRNELTDINGQKIITI